MCWGSFSISFFCSAHLLLLLLLYYILLLLLLLLIQYFLNDKFYSWMHVEHTIAPRASHKNPLLVWFSAHLLKIRFKSISNWHSCAGKAPVCSLGHGSNPTHAACCSDETHCFNKKKTTTTNKRQSSRLTTHLVHKVGGQVTKVWVEPLNRLLVCVGVLGASIVYDVITLQTLTGTPRGKVDGSSTGWLVFFHNMKTDTVERAWD